MGLAEKLASIKPNSQGLPCGIRKIIDGLKKEEDIQALQNIMEMRTYPHGVSNRQIHGILLEEGYDIAFASIRLHRSKQCRCYIGKNSPIRSQNRTTITKSNSHTKVAAKKKVASTKPKPSKKSK